MRANVFPRTAVVTTPGFSAHLAKPAKFHSDTSPLSVICVSRNFRRTIIQNHKQKHESDAPDLKCKFWRRTNMHPVGDSRTILGEVAPVFGLEDISETSCLVQNSRY